jgi:hypothetical protein
MSYLSLPAALVLLVAIALSLSTLPFRRRFLRRTTAMARKKVIGDELSAHTKENGFEPWRRFAVWSTTKSLAPLINVSAVQAYLR